MAIVTSGNMIPYLISEFTYTIMHTRPIIEWNLAVYYYYYYYCYLFRTEVQHNIYWVTHITFQSSVARTLVSQMQS